MKGSIPSLHLSCGLLFWVGIGKMNTILGDVRIDNVGGRSDLKITSETLLPETREVL